MWEWFSMQMKKKYQYKYIIMDLKFNIINSTTHNYIYIKYTYLNNLKIILYI